jgi:hypothetical protein
MRMDYNRFGIIALFLVFTIIIGCASRIRLDLFMDTNGKQQKVKVELTQFVSKSVLLDPKSDEKLRVGDGNCVIITTGTRGKPQEKISVYDVLQYDEYIKCRLYLQLPSNLVPGSQPLEGRSFVQILGRYDKPVETKLFLPKSGSVIVDSVANDRLFGTINGKFANAEGSPLNFNGKFKVKIKD